MKNHYVYIIQAKTMRLLKFGRTSRMSVRLAELQIGSPDELALIWLSGAMGYDEACRAEKYLHDKLNPFHVHGEWFAPEPEVIAFVDGLVSAAPSGMEGTDIRLLESVAEFKSDEITVPPISASRQIFQRNHKSKRFIRDGKKRSKDYVVGNTAAGNTVRLSEVQRERAKK